MTCPSAAQLRPPACTPASYHPCLPLSRCFCWWRYSPSLRQQLPNPPPRCAFSLLQLVALQRAKQAIAATDFEIETADDLQASPPPC